MLTLSTAEVKNEELYLHFPIYLDGVNSDNSTINIASILHQRNAL
jgi:hypothetical protein